MTPPTSPRSCAPDPTTYGDALAVLARYEVKAPPEVMQRLKRGEQGQAAKPPSLETRFFRGREPRHRDGAAGAHGAEEFFHSHGVQTTNLGDRITGEASEVAKVQEALARRIAQGRDALRPPVAIVSGGECTVTVSGSGRGGRNTEFLLSLAIGLDGLLASTPSPAIPTGSTARKTTLAPCCCPIRSPARRAAEPTPGHCSSKTTPTGSSPRSRTSSRPADAHQRQRLPRDPGRLK